MSGMTGTVRPRTESGDSGEGGEMKTRSLISVVGAIALGAGIMVAAAPATSAANCRPSTFGSTDFMGNPRYSCPDGTYTLRRPFGSSSWDDPMTSYELRPNYGSSWNRPSQKCRYNSLFDRYECR